MQRLLKNLTNFFTVVNYIGAPIFIFVLLFLPLKFNRTLDLVDIFEIISLLILPIVIILSLIYSRKYYKISDYKKSFIINVMPSLIFLLEIFVGSFF